MRDTFKSIVLVVLLNVAVTACSDRAALPSEARVAELSAADAESRPASLTTHEPRKIALLDDCKASDPWPGGCSLTGGSVSLAEFRADFPRGHAAWRNDPSYLKIWPNKDVKVVNEGGRDHTLTEVASYGGGILAQANIPGQPLAPECQNAAVRNATLLRPGESMRISGLQTGTHKFQCCFHPWMTAEIRVH